MYHAPSVSYPVGRCAFQRGLWGLGLVLSLAVLVAWWATQAVGVLGVLAACCLLAGGWLGWRDLGVQGLLQWDGQAWYWQARTKVRAPTGVAPKTTDATFDALKPGMWHACGRVQVVLDLQSVLLLCWQAPSEQQTSPVPWLWLDRRQAPHRWQDMRRAVFASAPVQERVMT